MGAAILTDGVVQCIGFGLPSVAYLWEWLRSSSRRARDSVQVRSLPTPRRPLLRPATGQDPVSSNTRYLRLRRNTTHLPARTPMGHLRRLHTAHLPPGNMRHLPVRLDHVTDRRRVCLFRGRAGAARKITDAR